MIGKPRPLKKLNKKIISLRPQKLMVPKWAQVISEYFVALETKFFEIYTILLKIMTCFLQGKDDCFFFGGGKKKKQHFLAN